MFFHLSDSDGNLVVDFLIRMEHSQQDVDRLCELLGLPKKKLPRRASSMRDHYSVYYDERSREIISDFYADDIREFGYSFEVT